jgi:hypothetical protein
MWKCPDCATPQLCAAERFDCGHDKTITVGSIIKWRSYFGEKTGKVVDTFSATASYVSENRSTQGFPGISGPTLVSHKDITEVVSRG